MKCPKCQSDNPETSRFCAECGTQLHTVIDAEVSHTKTLETPAEELTRGTTIASRYEIIEELGKGGMGKVYRVYDKKIEGEVALKLIKPEIAADKKTIERFRNELKHAREISHRNVCRMYDLGEEEGTHYITMEYVPGEDLKSFIRRAGPLGSGKAIFIAKQACEGLAEAHRIGVIHRDLKPKNIMIDTEGNARIMDFGIARSLKTKGITGTGVMIGTPEYMSPEQVEGKEVDQRSDIYSLGIILYEMVTGQVPFEGETPFSIGLKHKSEEPEDPRKLNSQIPEDLSRLILYCLEKEKENRCQSAEEVRSEIIKIEKGIPSTEREIPKRKPITSKEITVTFKLKKLMVPALVVIVVAIIGIIIWQLLPKGKPAPIPTGKPSLVIMYFKNNTGDAGFDHWRMMLSNLLTADLSQSKHVRILSEDKLFNILSQLDQLEAETYSSEVLEEVASQGGVSHILQGAYAKVGDEFRINVMVQEAGTGEITGSELVSGKGEESVFSMVDDLTRKIKMSFDLSPEEIEDDIDQDVEKITTNSPEALKYYIEGKRLYEKGKFGESNKVLEKAISLDPAFALAHLKISDNYNYMGKVDQADEYLLKAMSLLDRVSKREYYLIQGYAAPTTQMAIENYKKLLNLYPDDLEAIGLLGAYYRNMEEWDLALERFEKIVEIDKKEELAYENIAHMLMAKGQYDRAQEILKSNQHILTNQVSFHVLLGTSFLCQSKYDLALGEVGKAGALGPEGFLNDELKGNIYQIKGDIESAEKTYRQLMNSDDYRSQYVGRFWLSYLYLMLGKYKQCKQEISQGLEHSQGFNFKPGIFNFWLLSAYINFQSKHFPEALETSNKAVEIAHEIGYRTYKNFSLHFRGLIYVKMKKLEDAKKEAQKLKLQIEKSEVRKHMRHYHSLMGEIAREEGSISRAISDFEVAFSLLPQQYFKADAHILFLDSLASAYYESGDIDKALKEYEKIVSLTTGRLRWGDLYSRSFYWIGKIYEQKGMRGKAVENYQKFLELWKDADPGLPEVDDARKRLAELKSN